LGGWSLPLTDHAPAHSSATPTPGLDPGAPSVSLPSLSANAP
jgi:hypothetical protein